MNILISHTSVAPFVQEAALALYEAGWLDRFVTTLRHDSRSKRQQHICRLAARCGYDFERQLKRRRITTLPPEKVTSRPVSEIVRLLVSKVDRSRRLTDLVWERMEPAFDRTVSRLLTSRHDAVYAYEFSALASFRRAGQLGVRTIYDVPAPETHTVRRILDREVEKFPLLRTAYQQHTAAREDRRTIRRRAEWHAADLVIAASTFTRDSFAAAGLDVSKVRIVPYGAPPAIDVSQATAGGAPDDRPLSLLWAGTFSHRKGAHYLLQAWRNHDLGRIARLRVFGANVLPAPLLHPLPSGIEFGGSIPREELMAHYQSSDALVFPTLCDGFGMVVTEAWSRGLPVITTRSAGAADLLQPNRNGLLCEPADPASLADAIRWCHSHRSELRTMRPAACETAAGWQWIDDRAALRGALSEP